MESRSAANSDKASLEPFSALSFMVRPLGEAKQQYGAKRAASGEQIKIET